MALALLCVIFLRQRAIWLMCGVFPDMNLPVVGIAFVLVAVLLKLKTPPGTLTEKLGKIDAMYVPRYGIARAWF